MTNTFEMIAKDYTISFGEYQRIDGELDIVNIREITIEDCYFEHQAVDKFWQLVGEDYDTYVMLDCWEQEWDTMDNILYFEQQAILEHLFGSEFGVTDQYLVNKYLN